MAGARQPHHLWKPRLANRTRRAMRCERCGMRAAPIRVRVRLFATGVKPNGHARMVEAWRWRYAVGPKRWFTSWEMPPCMRVRARGTVG